VIGSALFFRFGGRLAVAYSHYQQQNRDILGDLDT